MRSLSSWLVRVEEMVSGSLVGGIVFLILAQVVCRRFFGRTLVWSEELCTLAFTAVTFIGAAAATARRSHVRLTLLLDRLPGAARWERGLELLLAAVFLALIAATARLVLAVRHLGLNSASLGLPMAAVYALVPLSLLLFALHLVLPRTDGGAGGEPGV